MSESIILAFLRGWWIKKKKSDRYWAKNGMHNYIQSNVTLCVHMYTYIFKYQTQKEISKTIVQDFMLTGITKNCFKFE